MSGELFQLDAQMPTFTGRQTQQEQIVVLLNYIHSMRMSLQFSLQNLTPKNFNSAAWGQVEEGQKEQIQKEVKLLLEKIQNINSAMNNLSTATAQLKKTVEALSEALNVSVEGSITLGGAGKRVDIVGEVYINGALFGGTTT